MPEHTRLDVAADGALPIVSIVLVNFRGADDTIEAIHHLGKLVWPLECLEIVVVENNSEDGSFVKITNAAPHVKVVQSGKNLGFAGGCNLGVKHSTGAFIGFLNNDARPDPDWVRSAVATFGSSSRIGAVASRVLDWDGKLVDYIGAGLAWFGMGYKPFTGDRMPPEWREPRDVLFGTGSAMFVKREVFLELCGFDERYFMFFEDVDFGWRLNLRGWRYRYDPGSLAFHKHHASMKSFGSFKESYLLERNALFTLYKNLSKEALDRALPAALALSIRRGVAKGDLDSASFDLRNPGDDREDALSVAKETLSSVFAIDQFVSSLPTLARSRKDIQGSRTVSDQKIWPLFGEPDAPSYENPYYLDGYMSLTTEFGVLDAPRRNRVLVITGDPIGAKLAGPAIRAWNIASALSMSNDVTLMSHSSIEQIDAPFELVKVSPGHDREFAPWEQWADVIIFQGHALEYFSVLERTPKILVADVYDPLNLEQLEQAKEFSNEIWVDRVERATAVLNQQLARADYFICASHRQRLYYLGQLAALGRLNPTNYSGDPDFLGLIDVVPFGMPREFPEATGPVLKGELAGIGIEDKVLLWSGGLYNWFDPKTLIRAVAMLSERRPEVRLFFQGTKHPHPGVPEMAVVEESRALAESLGILDVAVFFNRSWVDYAIRHNYLREADAGVSTHFSHIETTMSFRTRILDYLWAGLPMVVTDGDVFAELIAKEELGLVVPANDEASLADALERILYDTELIERVKRNIARAREEFYWDRVLQPLITFVGEGRHAPDIVSAIKNAPKVTSVGPRRPSRKTGIRHNAGRALFYLRNGGPIVVLRKVKRRLLP